MMLALVTAAGQGPDGGGLGAAICRVLVERGYSVVGWDADPAALERTADQVALRASRVVQVADAEAVERAMGLLEVIPELVVNCLSAPRRTRGLVPLEAMTALDVEYELDHGLIGAGEVCLSAARRMRAAGRGSIINVTSVLADHPAPGRSIYGAAAAAIGSLTRSLGAELASSGVRVNAVAPPGELAPGSADGLDGDPAGAHAISDEIAELVAFLGSPSAAALNGVVVRAERGFDPFPGLASRVANPSEDE